MLTTNDAVIVGTSELRSKSAALLQGLKDKKVIVTQRGKPKAVLFDFEEFQKNEEYIEAIEDLVLTQIATERVINAKKSDFLTMSEMQKLVFGKKN